MPEVATQVKEALTLENAGGFMRLATAGVSVFGGFALAAGIGNVVGPKVQEMAGDKIPIVSGGTVARAATLVVLGVVHGFAKDSPAFNKAWAGIRLKDITFFAAAGAAANVLGSLTVDVLNNFGGEAPWVANTKGWVGLLTGLGGAAIVPAATTSAA